MSPSASLRVGLIQTRTPATHAAALDHVAPLVREAIGQGARFVLTPECTNVLQKDRSKLLPTLTALADDPVVNGLREIAARHRLARAPLVTTRTMTTKAELDGMTIEFLPVALHCYTIARNLLRGG